MDKYLAAIINGIIVETGTSLVKKVGKTILSLCFAHKKRNIGNLSLENFKEEKLKEVLSNMLNDGSLSYREFVQINNFLDIAIIADQCYQEQQDANSKEKNIKVNFQEVDWDWMMRFFDAVGNISEKELHVLWAKILAGELSQKKSFSLRTLDLLKNLSVEEARLFHRVCCHSFLKDNSIFIPSYSAFIEYANISYDDILLLDDLGLINNNTGLQLNLSFTNEIDVLANNKHFALSVRGKVEDKKSYSVSVYRFTALGRELRSTLQIEVQDQDVFVLRNCVAEDEANKDMYFGVHRIQSIMGDIIEFETKEMVWVS